MQKWQIQPVTIPPSTLNSWRTMMNLLLEYLSVSDVGLWCPIHNNYTHNKSFERVLHAGEHLCDVGQCRQYVMQVARENRLLKLQTMEQIDSESESLCSYIGMPIVSADNQLFGVLSICTQNHHTYSQSDLALLNQFKTTIELQLKQLKQDVNAARQLNTDRTTNTVETLSPNTYTYFTRTLNREIGKRIEIEKQLYFHKYYDHGTGFFNRTAIEKKLRSMIRRLDAQHSQIAVFYIGFDNSRAIQHRFGMPFWDEILRRFRQQADFSSLASPIFTGRANTSDMYLIYQTEQPEQDIATICEELTNLSQTPMTIEPHNVHLRINIGVSTTHSSVNASTLLDQASIAMLTCRDSALSYCEYAPQLLESRAQTQQLENYLLNALRSDALTVYYQPKVDPISRRWQGAEALVRWKHPVLGEISNETLIHLAEKNGLIFDVGNFVLREAIAKASVWCQRIPEFKIAVNASVKQLKDTRFIDTVCELLEEYQLPANNLEIEMTESGIVTDEDSTQKVLAKLHQLGITLSLDDFGTGFASFSYLKKFPFDGIKIDKSFILTLDSNPHDRAIASSMIQIAKKMGLSITIEGIETSEQECFIIEEGGNYGQGYLYGRPMPEAKFEASLFKNAAFDTTVKKVR